MKFLSIVLTLFFLEGSPQWGSDFGKAKSEAVQNKKCIVINFSGSDWCGPCIKLKRDILDSPEFLDYATQNLVLVRADFPRLKKNQLDKKQIALNEALADKYNQEGKFPLTVLVSPEGKILKEWDGYPAGITTESFLQEIQTILNARK
ncbi:Disulfide bond reductase DsbH [Emticicia aquatica]|jgi:thioredoxin-related protein|uniref:Disulfide bond reductase DsbH n=1 Tax=Emticicia aquatica TaxID=1681835 RepID=A0ABN8ESW8_9BACT|nr:thioredoxin family protein [Emticicia aquatica]CAH0994654.1 Disulfide bond reductase DsbH [Emticicia aquatica]